MFPADRQDRREDPEPSRQRLYRDTRRAWLAGVCAGIADYFGVSAGLVRFLTFLSAVFFTMPAVFGYFIAALVLKRRPSTCMRAAKRRPSGARSAWSPAAPRTISCAKFQELERRLRAAEARVTSSEFRLRRQFKDLEG